MGVATQDPELRKNFHGKPEYVVNFMHFIAQEVREYMAMLGFRTIDEMVGRTEVLLPKPAEERNWEDKNLDLAPLLYKPEVEPGASQVCTKKQNHQLEKPPKRVNRPEACGLRHLAFCVDSVEQMVKELTEVGIECEPIRVDDYTGKKMTFFHDPDGLPLELHE